MAKLRKLRDYITIMKVRAQDLNDEDFVKENIDLIELAASNKRLLDRFDMELDGGSLTMMLEGSTGQMKRDINPIVKHRNDISKLYADNLEALMLTPRARFKKQEAKKKEDENDDPTLSYFKAIHKERNDN